ncbi:MAG TPA: PH domain-containing protein [Terriglobales bacterium]|nr:PH domain-containing protein [Terriglobales bacterium]
MTSTIPAGDVFTASRFTRGNLFFPTKIVVNSQHVSRIKSRFFGASEESIGIAQVASVHISTGMIWSDIVIESAGGTDPITSHGHKKADAQRIRELIEGYQSSRRA